MNIIDKIIDNIPEQYKVSEEIRDYRMSICENCEQLDKKTIVCQSCNCPMNRKTRLTTSSCPLGKWSKISI
jgi:hypothetical protein